MKFAHKIIISCLILIMAVYSIGSTIMLVLNHQQLLQTTIEKNLETHDIELFSMETKLLQDRTRFRNAYKTADQQMLERFSYYIDSYSSGKKNTTYALYDNQNLLYSAMDKGLSKKLSNIQTSTYQTMTYDSKKMMVVTSKVSFPNQDYYLSAAYDLSDVYAERTREFKSFLLIGSCLCIISYIVLKFIASYMTEPIEKLNKAAQHIAKGNYKERTLIESTDEIGELSKSFDMMALEIEQTISKLQLNLEQRDEFMGSFSHEIKTPMTSILGYADILRTYDCDPKTRTKAAQYIYSEGQRLASLSYTMMDLLSLGENEIQLETVDAVATMIQLENYYAINNKKRNVYFYSEECYVLSHSDLLFAMLRNIIDNAIKASKEDQTILVLQSIKDNKCIFMIIDEGVGMEKETIDKMTEPFYMADKSRARSLGGAGLGMSIVKRICDLHHTNLIVDSALGIGTTITMTLEVAKDE